MAKYPEVERTHIKLWVGTTGVLDSILNAATHVISREEVEKTSASAKIYVRNPSFDEALAILKKHKVCIISGIPGIGKTTLARMLLLYFYNLKFDVVKITEDISEAKSVEYNNKARFYYYDDFLGQTGQADKLSKNEDQRLLDFMSHIRDSKSSVFVLTTREYILNQAKIQYEKIDRARFDHTICIVDLSKYSRRIKAEILYNHLHFSKLPKVYIRKLIEARGYLKIVDHQNYNPRLIEYLTDPLWLGDVDPSGYLAVFIHKLNNPAEIWSHAFSHQLAGSSRNLLFVLTSVPSPVVISDLKKAFESFHSKHCTHLGVSRNFSDFTNALKELDGTFITTESILGRALIRFHNPSIRDFMQNKVMEGDELANLIDSLVFFEQAHWFIKLLQEKTPRLPMHALKRLAPKIQEKLIANIKSKGCAISVEGTGVNRWIFSQTPDFATRSSVIISSVEFADGLVTKQWASQVLADLGLYCQSDRVNFESCLRALDDFKDAGFANIPEWNKCLSIIKNLIFDRDASTTKFETVVRSRLYFPEIYSDQEMEYLSQEFGSFVEEFDDFSDFRSPEDFREAAVVFSDLGAALRVSTQSIEDRLEEIADEKEDEQSRNWDEDDDRRPSVSEDACTDSAIDSMFETLEPSE